MVAAFQVGDTVLAYHGMVIYEAKVMKIDHGQGVTQGEPEAPREATPTTQYYVHYQGWSKKWDEWVRHELVLKDDAAGRAAQQKAKAEMDKVKREKSALARKKKISTAGIDTAGARKSPFKKMKVSVETETEEMPPPDEITGARGGAAGAKAMSVQMPFALKKQLVEDWKQVTHEPHKLVPLPRQPTVRQIVKTYLEFKKSKVVEGDAAQEKEFKNVEGIMEGVQAYFDRALGSILLYRMERKQYQDIKAKHEDTPASEIYGAEHLVRLFVRLPVLLGSTTLPAREISQIQSRLNDFLKFMQKNSASWFVSEYQLASELATSS